MITGVVTPFHQATIRLTVRGPAGQAQEIEAVIDPLVGMSLLHGYELTIQAVIGGQVIIKALP